MSPFHDLARRYGSPLPAEKARSLPSPGRAPAAGEHIDANAELHVFSLQRFVRLLSLGVLGLIGLLSFGVGGVVFVQGSVFQAPKVGIRESTGASRNAKKPSTRAKALRGSGASARATAGGSSAKVLGDVALWRRWAAQFGPALRGPAAISKNQPETLEAAYLAAATPLAD